MREILFRGKDFSEVINHSWYFGSLDTTEDDRAIIIYLDKFGNKCQILVNPETVGQYTGLKDKNGAKIFEGDIVTMPKYGGGRHKSAVYFKGGKFAVDGSNYGFKDICPKNMQVVGNIYDNKLGDDNNGTC